MDLYALYQQPQLLTTGLIILAIWVLVWKGLALWHAARNNHKSWYVVLLIINTLGILPIIYLIWFRKKSAQKPTEIRVEGAEDIVEKPKKARRKSAKKS